MPDLVGYLYAMNWYGFVLFLGHSCPQAFCFAMGWPRSLLAALWALWAMEATALRLGAFNIQSFGDNKVSDPDCGSVIAQILAGYDIVLVQEVRDPDLSAVSLLMEQINRESKHEYSFVSSKPLGRDQYKEMYLFVYRPLGLLLPGKMQCQL